MARKPSKEVATTPKGGVPAAAYDYGDMGGAGYDGTTADDFAIPFLAIMQSNSPQVEDEEHPAQIGMLFNTVTEELFDGKEGITLVPCVTEHVFVEWKPRSDGGGFVKVHTTDSETVKQAKEAAKEFGDYKVGENDLVETFYMYCMVLREGQHDQTPTEFVIVAFTGTKIKAYKRIMGRLRMFKGNPPLFAHRILVRTVAEENQHGKYRNFQIEPAVEGDVGKSLTPPQLEGNPHPVLMAGQEFGKQVREGLARASYESVKRDAGQGSGESTEDEPF